MTTALVETGLDATAETVVEPAGAALNERVDTSRPTPVEGLLEQPGEDVSEDPLQAFRHLPERIPFDQMTTTQPASGVPAPDLGRDPDRDWLVRFGAG